MLQTATFSIVERIGAAFSDFFLRVANSHWAAKDIERYSAMSDAELATHNLTRDQIAEHVLGRYMV